MFAGHTCFMKNEHDVKLRYSQMFASRTPSYKKLIKLLSFHSCHWPCIVSVKHLVGSSHNPVLQDNYGFVEFSRQRVEHVGLL